MADQHEPRTPDPPSDPDSISSTAQKNVVGVRYRLHLDYFLYEPYCRSTTGKLFYRILRPKGAIGALVFRSLSFTLAQLKVMVINHLRVDLDTDELNPVDTVAKKAENSGLLKWSYVIAEPNTKEKRGTLWCINQPSSEAFDIFVDEAQRASAKARVWIHIAMPQPGDVCIPMADNPISIFDEAGVRLSLDDEWGRKRRKIDTVTYDLSLPKFFDICKIPFDSVADLLSQHQITHWSAFIGASTAELTSLGFKWGPAKLIVAGTKEARKLPYINLN